MCVASFDLESENRERKREKWFRMINGIYTAESGGPGPIGAPTVPAGQVPAPPAGMGIDHFSLYVLYLEF